MLANLEIGQVEAERLHATSQVEQPAVGDALCAMRYQARDDQVQVDEQRLAGGVAAGAACVGTARLSTAAPLAPRARGGRSQSTRAVRARSRADALRC